MTTKEQFILALPLSIKFRETTYKLHIGLCPEFMNSGNTFYGYINMENKITLYHSDNIESLGKWLIKDIQKNLYKFDKI